PIATPTPKTTAAPVPRLSAAAKGKQPLRATTPTEPTYVERTEAEQLKIVLRRSRQETHISQQCGSGTDEGTGSRPGSDKEETRQEEKESFDLIPRTPKGSEDEGNDEEDQDLRLSEEARIQEEEEADELYHDIDINQGRGLQVTQNIEDSHVTLTPGQVKSQVKEQVSRILPRIKESVNATLEAEVLTRSSHSSRTSYVVAADLSEMELKKILIEKMEGNKSILRSDEQRNPYKELVEAYDVDKTILDTYGESTILKRRREDDDQEGPSAGSDRRSKRQREGGEHASPSTPSEIATRKEPMQTTCQMEEPSHPVFEIGAEDQPIVQTSQHPEWFSYPR
nr:hypothetical protein [Tanacetum cinerariifolium]